MNQSRLNERHNSRSNWPIISGYNRERRTSVIAVVPWHLLIITNRMRWCIRLFLQRLNRMRLSRSERDNVDKWLEADLLQSITILCLSISTVLPLHLHLYHFQLYVSEWALLNIYMFIFYKMGVSYVNEQAATKHLFFYFWAKYLLNDPRR